MSDSPLFWKGYRASYEFVKRQIIRAGLMDSALRPAARFVDELFRSRILGQFAPNPAIVEGGEFHYPPSDRSLAHHWVGRTFEVGTTRLIAKVLRRGMTFLDVGAYAGYYTMLASKLVGREGRVFSFEPDPAVLRYLRKNIQVNGYEGIVTIIPKAVGGSAGTARLYHDHPTLALASLFSFKPEDGPSAEVAVTTLDDFFLEFECPRVDLIKMDIEGSESAALQGMALLSRQIPDLALIIEFNVENQTKAGTSPESLLLLLVERGFTVFYVIGDSEITPIQIPRGIMNLVELAVHSPPNLLCCKRIFQPGAVF